MVRGNGMVPAALLLAGCGGASDPPVAGASPTPVALPDPARKPTPSAAATVPAATPPPSITITTNEPFHAAVIEGPVLTLSGVDMAERRMAVIARDAVSGGWRWRARDSAGEVVATVTTRACEDDMSGDAREFTGVLRIGGRDVRGCAFRTPADRIPARFVGRWDRDAAACADPAGSIGAVTIRPGDLRFHESIGTIRSVASDRAGIAIVVAYEGEGERWTTRQRLTIDGERLTIAGEGAPIRRVRCPPA